MNLAENINYLGPVGLAWDIAGAVLLSRGLLSDDNSIARIMEIRWYFAASTARSLCEHRINTRFGLSLLVVGFTIQGASSIWIVSNLIHAAILASCVFIPIGWLLENYRLWVLLDVISVVKADEQRTIERGGEPKPIEEYALRLDFRDYPELTWKTAVINSRYEFKRP